MGKLLANPKAREKAVKLLKSKGPMIGTVSYVVGVLWMLALPHHELSARNYFSENQLLPGLVDTYFSMSHYTQNVFRKLQNVKREGGCRAVKNLILEEFYKHSFDVYEQNFEVESLREDESPGVKTNGSNVYGILRAPRASGVESIILNVPLKQDGSSSGSLALMLSIASYFRDQTYWAKDIIFVVTEHELYGIQAWLNGYFQDTTPGIRADDLRGHGGSIQAAVVLDFPQHIVNHFDILFVGANGLLPNLDFINLMSRIASLEGVPSKFLYQAELFRGKDNYAHNLETLLGMMAMQASGYPSGNHGMFFKYRIEAVTLRGVINPQGRYRKEIRFEAIGRMIEGIFRSINNMLEHFHQSFFLYVLPNTHTYISIGMYMPPLGCLVLPIAIHLIVLWIRIFKLDRAVAEDADAKGGDAQDNTDTKGEGSAEESNMQEDEDDISSVQEVAKNGESLEDGSIKNGCTTESLKSSENEVTKSVEMDDSLTTMSLLVDGLVLQQVLLSFLLSLCCYFGLDHYFRKIVETSTSSQELCVVLSVSCFGAVVVASLLQPSNRQLSDNSDNQNINSNQNLKFFGLLHLLLIVIVTSVFNFSAAFVVALFYVPLAITIATITTTNKYGRLVQLLFSILSSPPLVVFLVVVASDVSLDDFETFDWLEDAIGRWHDVVVEAHVNRALPIWTKDVFYLTVLPMWITLSANR